MKLFIKRALLWILPIILLYTAIEIYITEGRNNFNARVNYLKENKDIEVLFLGSSHTQYGINQEFLNCKASNMAYAGQDYQIDNAIFFKYVKSLEKLQYVFLELDYFSLEEKIPNDFFKIPWYYKYHNIEIEPVSALNKISLYSSSPSFFNRYLIDKLNPFESTPTINEFGFSKNDKTGDFFKANFDSLKIVSDAVKRLNGRHTEASIENYAFNKVKLEEIITYCNENNIKVVMMRFPVYKTYKDSYNLKKLERNQKYRDSLLKFSKVEFLDFENDNDFSLKDYKDDDHLNEFGAKKLTSKIDLFLETKMSKK